MTLHNYRDRGSTVTDYLVLSRLLRQLETGGATDSVYQYRSEHEMTSAGRQSSFTFMAPIDPDGSRDSAFFSVDDPLSDLDAFFEARAKAYREIRADGALWQEELEERALWEGTIADGLDEDEL